MGKNACDLCGEDATGFQEGSKGKRADITKILFVLHKPDSRIMQGVLGGFDPYLTVLSRTKTGAELSRMLNHCELTLENIYITNIFKCTLSGDRLPTKKEYKNCLEFFNNEVAEFDPKKLVAFGSMVFNLMFPDSEKQHNHKGVWAKEFCYKGRPVFILPHPSKTYYYSEEKRVQRFYNPLKTFLSRD